MPKLVSFSLVALVGAALVVVLTQLEGPSDPLPALPAEAWANEIVVASPESELAVSSPAAPGPAVRVEQALSSVEASRPSKRQVLETAEMEPAPVDPRIPPNYIFGDVTTRGGGVVTSGRVEWVSRDGTIRASMELNEGGQYWLNADDRIPRYEAQIRAVADGYVTSYGSPYDAVAVELDRWHRLRLDFELDPSQAPELSLRFPDGEPVVGAVLHLARPTREWDYGREDPIRGTGTADESGVVRITGMPLTGLYEWKVDLPGAERWGSDWYRGPIDLAKEDREIVVPRPASLEVNLGEACLDGLVDANRATRLWASEINVKGRQPRSRSAVVDDRDRNPVVIDGLRQGVAIELSLTGQVGLTRTAPRPIVIESRRTRIEVDCADWLEEDRRVQKRGQRERVRARWRLVDAAGEPVNWERLGSRLPGWLPMSWTKDGATGSAHAGVSEHSPGIAVGGDISFEGPSDVTLLVPWAGKEHRFEIGASLTTVDLALDVDALLAVAVPIDFHGTNSMGHPVALTIVRAWHLEARTSYVEVVEAAHPTGADLRLGLPQGEYIVTAESMERQKAACRIEVLPSTGGGGQRIAIEFPGRGAVRCRLDCEHPVLGVLLTPSGEYLGHSSRYQGTGPSPSGEWSFQNVQAGEYDVVVTGLIGEAQVAFVATRRLSVAPDRVNSPETIMVPGGRPPGVMVRRSRDAEPVPAIIFHNGRLVHWTTFQPGDGVIVEGGGQVTVDYRNSSARSDEDADLILQVDGEASIVEF